MTCNVENESGAEFPFDEAALIQRVVQAALDAEGCPYEAEVNVLITDGETIRRYNRNIAGSTGKQTC